MVPPVLGVFGLHLQRDWFTLFSWSILFCFLVLFSFHGLCLFGLSPKELLRFREPFGLMFNYRFSFICYVSSSGRIYCRPFVPLFLLLLFVGPKRIWYCAFLCSCMQKAKFDIGGEAVHRFSLSAEDKATLELAEWVDSAFKKASVCSLFHWNFIELLNLWLWQIFPVISMYHYICPESSYWYGK